MGGFLVNWTGRDVYKGTTHSKHTIPGRLNVMDVDVEEHYVYLLSRNIGA